jgi:hypothetical protein
LAKKPASGGMPASENSMAAKQKAMAGCVRAKPDRSSTFSSMKPWRRMPRMQAKAPTVIAA